MPKDFLEHSPLAAFIVTNCAALTSAAALLGGSKAERHIKALVDDFTPEPVVTRRLNRALDALEDLLSLHLVDDLETVEAERFARLDPEHPAVEEICLLLEGLRMARTAETCIQ